MRPEPPQQSDDGRRGGYPGEHQEDAAEEPANIDESQYAAFTPDLLSKAAFSAAIRSENDIEPDIGSPPSVSDASSAPDRA
jgi:hypothetical protein